MTKAFPCSAVTQPGEREYWVWGLEEAELSKPHVLLFLVATWLGLNFQIPGQTGALQSIY